MKLSIIVPVYNIRETYLAKCLWSLARQRGDTEMEVLIVDDGSTNGCSGVIRKFVSAFPQFHCIRQENQGTSAARNAGLDRASGEYVMFVDGDDFLAPDCVERVMGRMEENPVDILFFGYATAYRNRRVKRVLGEHDPAIWERESLERSVLEGNPAFGPVEVGSPWGKLIRRGAIESDPLGISGDAALPEEAGAGAPDAPSRSRAAALPEEAGEGAPDASDRSGTAALPEMSGMKGPARYQRGLKKGQDTVFILNLLERCASFAYFPYLGYYYRISAGSVSKRYQPDIVPTMENMLSAYRSFAEDYRKGDRYLRAVGRKYCKVILGEYLELRFLHPDNPEPFRKRLKEFRALTESEPYRTAIAECDPDSAGTYLSLQLYLLQVGRLKTLFFLKKLEMRMRDAAARKYG